MAICRSGDRDFAGALDHRREGDGLQLAILVHDGADLETHAEEIVILVDHHPYIDQPWLILLDHPSHLLSKDLDRVIASEEVGEIGCAVVRDGVGGALAGVQHLLEVFEDVGLQIFRAGPNLPLGPAGMLQSLEE